VNITNVGSIIEPDMLERVFEYGVSDPNYTEHTEHRGQGLFVAKTYMAKMGGTIFAENIAVDNQAGVRFVLTLQRVSL
jgi:sensor histidine kinase regulating citrate/malate metabolism